MKPMEIEKRSFEIIAEELAQRYPGRKADPEYDLLIRRVTVAACSLIPENEIPAEGPQQLDLFTDYDRLERERKIQGAMLRGRAKYGANALFTGKNLMEDATTLMRNMQIGGHRA